MPVYAIITEGAEPEIPTSLERNYPNKWREWSNKSWLVSTPDNARTLSGKIGVMNKDEDGVTTGTISGVLVTRLSPSYWGYATSDFWDWLSSAHEGEA